MIQHSACFLPRSDQDSNLLVESWSNSLRLITCVLMPNSSIGVAVQVRSGMSAKILKTGTGSDPLTILISAPERGKASTARRSEANSLPLSPKEQSDPAQANPRCSVLADVGGRGSVQSSRLSPMSWALSCALRPERSVKPTHCHNRWHVFYTPRDRGLYL